MRSAKGMFPNLLAVVILAACAGPVFGAAAPAAGGAQALAAQILDAAAVKGGLIVHLGCGDGKLTAALRAGDSYLVQGLDADPQNVAAARQYIQSLGLYGKVSVERLTDTRLPYTDNLVNLVVIGERATGIAEAEVLRVLAPGGVAVHIGPQSESTGPKLVKPRPKGIDEWTHWLHGADGNAVAKDSVVGPPQGVQWVEGPLWARHHELNASVTAMVSAGGRVFYICDEAPATVTTVPDQWMLIARDAFSGVLLWKRPMQEWGWKAWSLREAGGRFTIPIYIARRLVAVGDRVYVTLGFNAPLTALDAATGKTVREYEGTQFTDEVMCAEGLLVLSVNKAAQKPGLIADSPSVKKQIVALKADSGEVLWRQGDYTGISSKDDFLERITHLGLAVAGAQVFFLEEDAVVSLDLKTGRELWRTPRPAKETERGHVPYKPFNLCTLIAGQDVVLFTQPEEPYTRNTWNRGVKVRLLGLSAKTGAVLWTQECGKWGPGVEGDVFVINGLVWTHAPDTDAAIGIDLRTGEVKRKFSTAAAFNEAHHHRCYRDKATENYLLTARRGIEFIDLKGEQCGKNHWVRGGCRYGIMPCNGLVYVPPHACQCYIDVKLSGFYALAPARESSAVKPQARDDARLERGPAYGQTGPAAALPDRPAELPGRAGAGRDACATAPGDAASDWPTYRHDIARSGTTTTEVLLPLKCLWQAPLGGRVSACTTGGGRVFAAAVDQHRVCALDMADGRLIWDYTAGGRVDTPPTIHEGLVLFGAADGWVYCLRAADGKLAWRFRAAPQERRIVAFGQVESPWPVHGAVLVKDGLACVAAGRSTHLDGGIHVYALKPRTGELIRELRPLNNQAEGLEDVLVSDGNLIYMRQLQFSLSGEGGGARGEASQPAWLAFHAFSTAGLLDPSYFSRVGWSTGAKGGGSELLIFDELSTYSFRTRRSGGFGGWFQPGTGAYGLAALDRKLQKPRWSQAIPVRVRAMVAAGETLFVAGPPDLADPKDPLGAFEDRKGAQLWAFAASDGQKLVDYRLESPPVFDGMAAAAGRLFLATTDGKVVCLGKP